MTIRFTRGMRRGGVRLALALATLALPLAAGCSGDATLPNAPVNGLWEHLDAGGSGKLQVALSVQGDSVSGFGEWIEYLGGMSQSTPYSVEGHVRGTKVSLRFTFVQTPHFTYDATVSGGHMTGTLKPIDPDLAPRPNFVFDLVTPTQ